MGIAGRPSVFAEEALREGWKDLFLRLDSLSALVPGALEAVSGNGERTPYVMLEIRSADLLERQLGRLRRHEGGCPVFLVGSQAAGTHLRTRHHARVGVDGVFLSDQRGELQRASATIVRSALLVHYDGGVSLSPGIPGSLAEAVTHWVYRNPHVAQSVEAVARHFQRSVRSLEREFAESAAPPLGLTIRAALLARARALRSAASLPWRDVAGMLCLSPSALRMRRLRAATTRS